MSEYTVINYVVEYRRTDGAWMTWLEDLGDDEVEAQGAFLRIWKRKHDPRKQQTRLVRRTAVITDEVLADEDETGAIHPVGHWTKTL